MPDDNYSNPEALAYDLRQRYAKLVGDHMEEVSLQRITNKFPEWLRSLEDLHTITKHRYKSKKKDEYNKDENYNKIIKNIITLANKYNAVWSGETQDPEGTAELIASLRELEEYIYFKMNEAGMFGSKRELTGLM